MRTAGIIAEYNPFHMGHKYMLDSVKDSGVDCTIALMSGCFTQRGEPAVFDKWSRARLAVDAGVNLVVELPYLYASSSAREFAYGGVRILNGLGVDVISFGCETADPMRLKQTAEFLIDNNESISEMSKELAAAGISMAQARTRAVEKLAGEETASLLGSPNNLLGIEYIKAIIEESCDIDIMPVVRKGAGHGSMDEKGEGYPSGTYIRSLIKNGQAQDAEEFSPGTAAFTSEKDFYSRFDQTLFSFLKYRILTMDRSELSRISGISEGLEARLKAAAADDTIDSLDALIDFVKSKRYTRTHISRIFMNVLVNLTYELHDDLYGISYARILAADEKGRAYLKHLKKDEGEGIALISNAASSACCDDKIKAALDLDMRAADIYRHIFISAGGACGGALDYKRIPYMK